MTDFKALLNEEQHEAVTAPDGTILVLAAADFIPMVKLLIMEVVI